MIRWVLDALAAYRWAVVLWCLFVAASSANADTLVAWGNNVYGQVSVPAEATNVVEVSAGKFHSIALTSDGRVIAWGRNTGGQTNVPSDLTNVIAVASGDEHNLALLANGSVVAWGSNSEGQCSVPTNLTDAVAIAAGAAHSVALRSNGSVIGWGRNYHLQATPPSEASPALAIAAGGDQTLVLRRDSVVVAWGRNTYGSPQLYDTLSNIVAVAAGTTFAVALRSDGSIYAWGDHYRTGMFVTNGINPNTNLSAIAAGYDHGMALNENGTVASWGSIDVIGGPKTNMPNGLSGVTAIAAGYAHALALTGNGAPRIQVHPQPVSVYVGATVALVTRAAGDAPIFCQWERDGVILQGHTNTTLLLNNAQLGDAGVYRALLSNNVGTAVSAAAVLTLLDEKPRFTAYPEPRAVARGWGTDFNAVAVGSRPMTFQWFKDGVAVAGATSNRLSLTNLAQEDNGVYVLVVSNHLGLKSSPPAQLEIAPVLSWWGIFEGAGYLPFGLSNIVAVDSGYERAIALRADGRAVVWNKFNGGLLNTAGATNLVAVASGYHHHLVLRADGKVFGSGSNVDRFGRYLGQADPPTNLADVVAIAAGGLHSVALQVDGTIVEWGDQSAVLVQSNVAAITSGYFQSAALRRDGTVYNWRGYQPPAGLSNVIAIEAGDYHVIALKADGSVVAWGYPNYEYQWAPPAGVSNVLSVAGFIYSYLLTSDGVVAGHRVPPDTNVALLAGSGHPLVLAFAPETQLQAAELSNARRANGEFALEVKTSRGCYYALLATDSLENANWHVVEILPGNGSTQVFRHTAAGTKFYRVYSR